MREYDGAGTILHSYVHGPGMDEVLIDYQDTPSWIRRFPHADERGSVIALSDPSGVSTINSYDEYGRPGAGNSGRFQYTGQMWLPTIGLQYSKARMYDPVIGRFMQTDPIGVAGGINLYAYTGNDPINLNDPLGNRSLNIRENALIQTTFAGRIRPVPVFEGGYRSTTFPAEVDFAGKDWSENFALEMGTWSPAEYAFWHEFYHVFEIQNGIVTWKELALNQITHFFSNKPYEYDHKKPFMKQNPEARAKYFASCKVRGECSEILDILLIVGNNLYLNFNGFNFQIVRPVVLDAGPVPTVFVDVNENGINDDRGK